MENDITNPDSTVSPVSEEQIPAPERKPRRFLSVKAAIIIAVILILAALAFYYRSFLVVATVDGSPISRLSVLKDLERQSGKAALDALITQKLIEGEAEKKGVSASDTEIAERIKNIEDQLAAQNQTLDEALQADSLTRADLERQIAAQITFEKLLGDKVEVTDREVGTYLTENKIEIPKGQEEEYKNQVRGLMRQQKMQEAAASLIDSLRSQAAIKYFVEY